MIIWTNLSIDVLLLISAPETSFIIASFLTVPLVASWPRERHEGNPLIKEHIFGQECGVPSFQDENVYFSSIFTFNQR